MKTNLHVSGIQVSDEQLDQLQQVLGLNRKPNRDEVRNFVWDCGRNWATRLEEMSELL